MYGCLQLIRIKLLQSFIAPLGTFYSSIALIQEGHPSEQRTSFNVPNGDSPIDILNLR